jgi:hypothetical protein
LHLVPALHRAVIFLRVQTKRGQHVAAVAPVPIGWPRIDQLADRAGQLDIAGPLLWTARWPLALPALDDIFNNIAPLRLLATLHTSELVHLWVAFSSSLVILPHQSWR